MINDYFKLAIRNLRKRKLRTWLTMLGIFISVATIFMLVSLSLGLQGAVKEQFETLGTDKFFIQSKTSMLALGSGDVSIKLTTDDVETVEKISGVKEATFMVMGNAKIEYNNKFRYFIVSGMDCDDEDALGTLIESSGLKIDEGRFLKKGDDKKIVIGSLYNENDLFEKDIRLKDTILLNGREYKVLGLAESVGNPSDDQNIYMTYKAFQELFNSGDRVDFILVQINEGEDISEVADKVEKKLRKARGVTEKTQDFEISTPEELLESFGIILNIITIFLAGVAAISLFVGGIGIANTMYTSVLERTREIGIMKAIGAQNKDILIIFLIESGLLGLVGGGIGVLLGYGASKTIEYIAVTSLKTNLLQAATPAYLIIVCLAFGFLIGAISGTLPALRASKTNVVDALRYE
jgi:putative ABC transport system permease protein